MVKQIRKNMLKYFIGFVVSLTISASANAVPSSFADLVDKSTPSVVNISTTQIVEDSVMNPFGNLFEFSIPNGQGFEALPDLFKKFYDLPNGGSNKNKKERKTSSLGSGFIISADGYVVTNHHVIDKADEIKIIFSDDTEYDAKIIGSDPKTDIAVLKIKTDNKNKKFDFVKFGDSDKSRVGDWVIAIGNPFGLGGSVSAGIISARARDINSGPFDDFIQTDAAINRGNSGGPLFNVDGDVIGVNSAIYSPSGGNVGIGFSVPASLAKPVIDQLMKKGFIERGWLGVKIQTVSDEIAESLGMAKAIGALVVEVTEDSPADKGDIKAGDVILSFDDKPVETMRKLPRIVAETPAGKKVDVKVRRQGKIKQLNVKVALLEEDDQNENSDSEDGKKDESLDKNSKDISGLKIKDITSDIRKKYNFPDDLTGVVIVGVDSNSKISEKPIRAGDVISSINQIDIKGINQAHSIIENAKKAKKKSALLLIYRGSNASFITLPLD